MAVDKKFIPPLTRDDSCPPLLGLDQPCMARFKAELEGQQTYTDLSTQLANLFQERQYLDCCWEEHENQREKLKELFLDSEKTVRENKETASRFYEIIRGQKQLKEELEKQIVSTRIDIDKYKEVKETMEKYVKQYSIFENFMEQIAVESDTDVREIFNRYEELEGVRLDITRILGAEMEAGDQVRQQLIELVKEKTQMLKDLTKRLAMLQISKKKTHYRRIHWESVVQQVRNKVRAEKEEAVVLRGACWDLYNEICRRRKVQPTASADDMASQLDYIHKSINFYKEVLTIASGLATPRSYGSNAEAMVKKRISTTKKKKNS